METKEKSILQSELSSLGIECKRMNEFNDKQELEALDEMFDIPRLYTSACSYAVQPVRLYPILMSVLLYNYKELTQCISEVERIEARLNSSKNKGSTKEKEKEEEQLAQPTAVPQQRQGQLRLSEF